MRKLKKRRILALVLSAAVAVASANVSFADEVDTSQDLGGGYSL